MSTPAPAVPTAKKSITDKIKAVIAWASSPTGRRDLGALVAAVTAIYTVLHRAGV